MIRLAKESDLEEINDIYNEAVLNSVATFDTIIKTIDERIAWFHSREDKHVVLVCIRNDKVVGWSSLNRYSDRAAYDFTVENSIYIHKDYRGSGFGKLLMIETLNKARQHGIHSILSR